MAGLFDGDLDFELPSREEISTFNSACELVARFIVGTVLSSSALRSSTIVLFFGGDFLLFSLSSLRLYI